MPDYGNGKTNIDKATGIRFGVISPHEMQRLLRRYYQMSKPKESTKIYLGDGVYADYEWGQIVLTTEDGGPEPTNRIVLESNVYDALVEFVNNLEMAS